MNGSDTRLNHEQGLVPALGEIEYRRTDDLLADSQAIIDEARGLAQTAVNVALVRRNWLLGRRIAEEELDGAERAEYGAKDVAGQGAGHPGVYRLGEERGVVLIYRIRHKASDFTRADL